MKDTTDNWTIEPERIKKWKKKSQLYNTATKMCMNFLV